MEDIQGQGHVAHILSVAFVIGGESYQPTLLVISSFTVIKQSSSPTNERVKPTDVGTGPSSLMTSALKTNDSFQRLIYMSIC